MPKHKAAMVTYLLIFSITVMAFGESESPGGKVVEVKSQKGLASLAGELNWSDNNTIYVMVPTSSQENSTSPANDEIDLEEGLALHAQLPFARWYNSVLNVRPPVSQA
jgi:hypothetical protein